MTSSPRASGGCLCGGVTYRVEGPVRDVWYCHCEHCRRTTGHHMAASQCASADLALSAEVTLTWYSHQPRVHYGFCRRCGSTLFWKVEDRPEVVSISAGTLDQPTGLTVAAVLYEEEAADYLAAAHGGAAPERSPGAR